MDFATLSELEESWRPLSDVEKVRAQALLSAASRWIQRKKPDLSEFDEDAKLVCIEVVKAAMQNPELAGHSSYSKSIGPWSRSGTLTAAAADAALVFLPWMRELLGISNSPLPKWYFGDCPR